jgi:hypothetical protein
MKKVKKTTKKKTVEPQSSIQEATALKKVEAAMSIRKSEEKDTEVGLQGGGVTIKSKKKEEKTKKSQSVVFNGTKAVLKDDSDDDL